MFYTLFKVTKYHLEWGIKQDVTAMNQTGAFIAILLRPAADDRCPVIMWITPYGKDE
jgi:hypothetical protein